MYTSHHSYTLFPLSPVLIILAYPKVPSPTAKFFTVQDRKDLENLNNSLRAPDLENQISRNLIVLSVIPAPAYLPSPPSACPGGGLPIRSGWGLPIPAHRPAKAPSVAPTAFQGYHPPRTTPAPCRAVQGPRTHATAVLPPVNALSSNRPFAPLTSTEQGVH